MQACTLGRERPVNVGTTNTHFQYNMNALELVPGDSKSPIPGVKDNFIVAAKNMPATDQLF